MAKFSANSNNTYVLVRPQLLAVELEACVAAAIVPLVLYGDFAIAEHHFRLFRRRLRLHLRRHEHEAVVARTIGRPRPHYIAHRAELTI